MQIDSGGSFNGSMFDGLALQCLRVKPRTQKQQSVAIVYDADCMQQPALEWFDPDYWHDQGAVSGEAQGRGSAWFIESEVGPAVLRQYLRGGQAARISRDRYLFNGFERSRPLREFNITAALYELGLAVPRPLAACCRRSGLWYTGALVTRRIEQSQPLADYLGTTAPGSGLWERTGATIRQFHEQGVTHADLNARNVLVAAGQVFLIDFDRARMGRKQAVNASGNLRRLKRSLEKLWPDQATHDLESCWAALLAGYEK